ncbi:hypothetical protein ISN45_Aa02g011350 [Arabidopsis thaliana x Arabidopsis arenosa]|uniref:Uncharacterized protein n=1 Tax=Arabidopsis thaliana x Arabidopsis arenosa TaxID=1240361 RepID=A0A8T2BIF5_9BRAS|nr:hypothetical protein ISN45_Aa02g011350 [Arabidopsis thaliana x Arabidopsis arenosa]
MPCLSVGAPFSVISVVNKDSSCGVSTMFSSPDSVLVGGKVDVGKFLMMTHRHVLQL